MNILERYKEMPGGEKDIYQISNTFIHYIIWGLLIFPSLVGLSESVYCLEKTDEMLRKRGELFDIVFCL